MATGNEADQQRLEAENADLRAAVTERDAKIAELTKQIEALTKRTKQVEASSGLSALLAMEVSIAASGQAHDR